MKKFIMLIICIFIFGSGGYLADQAGISEEITWYEMTEAQNLASKGDKKVLVYAEASWCTYCKKVEKEVFPRKDVQELISKYYYPVRVDIESDDIVKFNGEEMTEQEFSASMRVSGTPTFLFIDGEGNVLGGQPGFIPPDIFKALLAYIGSNAHTRTKFEQFYENEYQD